MSATRRQFCLSLNMLTHWGRDNIAAISQTTLLNAFSWTELSEPELRYKIPLKFVPRSPINNIPTSNGLAPSRRQVIIWTNDG